MALENQRKRSMMTQPAPPIKAAATTIIRRDTRVLMGRRQRGAVFLPDKFVFPGGRVDPIDANVPFSGALDPRCAAALRVEAEHAPEAYGAAALRELYEETGLRPAVDAIAMRFVYRAVTPPDMSRRFDARFFMIDANDLAGDLDQLSPPEDELSNLQWMTIESALEHPVAQITRDVLRHVQAGIPPDVVPWRMGDREDRITRLIPR